MRNTSAKSIPYRRISIRRLRCELVAVYICSILILATQSITASPSDYRFGQDRKWTSVSLLAGASLVSGQRSGIGANGFVALTSADSLYSSPRHLAFEYAEHSKRSTLAFGLEYTKIAVANNLKTELGIAASSPLTVSYIDAPITYRVSAFPSGKSALNFSAGLSFIPMIDIASSTESVFKSGSDETTGSAGGLNNKHADFGFGIGGEIGIEKRIASHAFLTAKAGFRRPFTGVTRPDFSFFLVGIRIFQR